MLLLATLTYVYLTLTKWSHEITFYLGIALVLILAFVSLLILTKFKVIKVHALRIYRSNSL